MTQEIKTIDLGGLNCYLAKTSDGGYVLIDTGISGKRSVLETELNQAGCKPGNLKLILLTHGDIDHADNAVFLREKYSAKIAMHCDDSGMVEQGNMGWNRKTKADRISMMGHLIMLISRIMLLLNQSGKFQTFKPDFYVVDEQDLSAYSLDAKILHLPGHSKGSIGLLMKNDAPLSSGFVQGCSEQALICGDMLMNFTKQTASITPPKPPHTTVAPRNANSRPTCSASAYVF